MKKKLLAMMMATFMGVTLLAGCGGGEDTQDAANDAKVEATGDESEDVADETDEADEVFDSLKEYLTCGYAGADESGGTLYWAVDDDVTKGMFVAVAADGSDVAAVAGDIVENDDGSITLADAGTDVTLTLTVEAVVDDEDTECFLLTTDDGVQGLVYEVDVSDVIDVMKSIAKGEYEMPDVSIGTEEYTDEELLAYIQETYTECYAGITDDEVTYAYVAFSEDNQGIFMFLDSSNNTSGSFVGTTVVDENTGIITITDETVGVDFSFGVTEVDGGYILDMGDLGTAQVEPVSAEEFTEAFYAIAVGTEEMF